MFASVYNKLHETGALSSSHISSELGNEQIVDEIESILQSVERSPTTTIRRISTRIGVPHTRFMANFTSAWPVSFSSTDDAAP